jgi:acyl-CoA hydrolase
VVSVQALYLQKRMSAADAIRVVRNGETVVVPTGVGEPPNLLTALAEARRDFRDVTVAQLLPVRKYGYFDAETAEHVRHTAYFFSGTSRPGGLEGWIDYLPAYFAELPTLIKRDLIPVDVVFSIASPMDEHGYFSLALAADYTMAAVEKARAIVLEINPNVPFANVQEAIGKYVAEMIPDGSTLQIGYGGIPDAVVMQLTDKRDLGIHTEMVGDGIMTLVEAGVITNRKKNYHHGKMLATFALGSKKLYQFMHRNPALEMHPVDFTNDPWLAGQNDNLHAINATMQVDFLGQCGSESLGFAPYSGTGGQADFVRAANRSNGGKSFIVLPSTAKDDTISRIVPTLSAGTHVTTSKNDVNYVVTEFGVAQLRGKTAKQRCQALINIAHPDFRAELKDAARRMKLL